MSLSPTFHILVFVRAPQPGSVKTRIARTLGDAAALEAYLELLSATTDRLASFTDVTLLGTPDHQLGHLAPWLRPGWHCQPQGTGTLGERLTRAVQQHFDLQPRPVLVLGSDCPTFDQADIRQAAAQLDSHDAVLGPAADGGYWLIGLRAPQTGLFNGIEWSTDQVLRQTLDQARKLGLSVGLARTLSDVDTAEDLAHWRATRSTPS